ncbi:hypothetical protein Vafri_21214 [Volvox africanus]|uniref:Peptidase A2 domain-containing protein n=1 Tax=Volvox africanus TaxID=51714 RepID=A0A8J4FDU8_9CHLO|nr:hypothetical protein Vafri_21214 [Volvox africanus]
MNFTAALLLGMQRIFQFELGTVLFNGVDVAGVPLLLPGLAYAIDVWYESPAPHPDGSADCFEPVLGALLLSTELALAGNCVLVVQAGGHMLNMLVDTGASDNFISLAEVNALGLSPQSSEWSQVTLTADGDKHPILGRVTLRSSVYYNPILCVARAHGCCNIYTGLLNIMSVWG